MIVSKDFGEQSQPAKEVWGVRGRSPRENFDTFYTDNTEVFTGFKIFKISGKGGQDAYQMFAELNYFDIFREIVTQIVC